MLIAVIDNGSTWLYDVIDKLDIDLITLSNEMKRRYIGWLVNSDSIKEIIVNLPINR